MADKFNKYKYIIVCAISLVIGIFLFGTKHPESSILFFVPVWIIFVIKDYYKNKYTNKIFMVVIIIDIISLFVILMKSGVPSYIRYILFYVVVVTFFDIYNYYQKYGLYHENIIETQQGYSGNILWKQTIRNSAKVVSKKGILFLPLKIKKIRPKQVLISEFMSYAIEYTLQNFSMFLNMPGIVENRNILQRNFIDNKDHIIRELRSLRNKVYKDIHKKLVSDLINFYEQLAIGGIYYLKHYTFSAIWEKMVERYLNNHFQDIESNKMIFNKEKSFQNNFHKEIFYPNKMNSIQNIQPDHYMTRGDKQFIFDAKYYNCVRGINYKQVAYYFFLERLSEDAPLFLKKKYSKTYTALILPGDIEQKIHFKFNSEFNSLEKDFVILEYYLNVRDAITSYLSE
ncbi:hypothetical protein [Ligilactobacillus animalis]|uniref:hypothetical protein n=1 Tax=Ligilactobacillus animalis TaxID=1605 RepID=UPI00241D5AB2|nr:hypothetical protein [Ligilactobacillus animalis]MDQ2234439.1 hypothetical protein [Ligilactobacillus animalis]